ncbi:MAG: TerC family protein [Dehalococcoidales bacterium]|nr:TerC family protein [Dehalococcoidales bacterium]
MDPENILWIVFAIIVPIVLIADLAIFQRKAHAIKTKEALIMTACYVALALVFALVIYFVLGQDKAFTFLTGYIVEYSLSMDNLFVFLLIFASFAVPSEYQHRVLFWGIVGAMAMRGIFIASGWAILNALHWVIYIFGAFLIYTAFKIATKKEEQVNPKKNLLFRLACKFLPVTDEYKGSNFLCRIDGRRLATPLLLVLIVVESTDVVFAVDSIPAILSITSDLFIVYTSNIFAILGLRALYFAIAGLTKKLVYLNYGLAAILGLLGVKMIGSAWFEVPVPVSLGAVVGILLLSALASYLWPPKKKDILSDSSDEESKKS